MLIHADVLFASHFWHAIDHTGLGKDGVSVEVDNPTGSRTHRQKFKVSLYATPKPGRRRKRNMQHIKQDPDDVVAATYDEWGFFIAHLFNCEPGARIGAYKDADDFHTQTHGAFRLQTATDVENYLVAR